MSHFTYSGDITPAIWLDFSAHTNTGAHSDADGTFLYQVANECLYEWDLVFDTGTGVHHLTRRARSGRRYFDSSLNTYVNPPVNASIIHEILHAQDAGFLTVRARFKLWYHTFFRRILEYIGRTNSDNHNLANPTSTSAVTNTFRRSGGRYHYRREEMEFIDVPCSICGYDVHPSGSGPPDVKLFIYMRSKEELTRSESDEIALAFIAADYTKINKYGRDRSDAWYNYPSTIPPIEICLETWERNTWQYFLNYVDLTRGRRILDQIVSNARAAGSTQTQVVRSVRDQIDRFVVTANHWGQRREDRTRESYQYALSNAFGSIHQSRWRASPVCIIRELENNHHYNMFESASQILQVGTGHCGEHADVSYTILERLASTGLGSLLGSIVNSGNANIDHAFVVGGIRPTEIIETTINNPRNHAGSIGDSIDVWDLRSALTSAGSGVDGYVCDPYLDPSQIAQIARRLLVALNSHRRRSRGLDTDFLYYKEVHPSTPTIPTVTAPSVRNV